MPFEAAIILVAACMANRNKEKEFMPEMPGILHRLLTGPGAVNLDKLLQLSLAPGSHA